MEHSVQKKDREVILGFDLERRVMVTCDERGTHAIGLTDQQIERIRNYWRWIATHPIGSEPTERYEP